MSEITISEALDWISPYDRMDGKPQPFDTYRIDGMPLDGCSQPHWFVEIDREKLKGNVLFITAFIPFGTTDAVSWVELFRNEAVPADRPELAWTVKQWTEYAHPIANAKAIEEKKSMDEWEFDPSLTDFDDQSISLPEILPRHPEDEEPKP